MKNWKTTLFGFLAALPTLAHQFGVSNVGHLGNGDFLGLAGALGTILFGYFAKDKNVTGGTTPNTGTDSGS